MKGSAKLEIPGFSTYAKNRVNRNGGGISTCVTEREVSHTVKIKEGHNEHEFIITRHEQFATPINIINIYGMNECRSAKNEIEEFWNTIIEEVNKIKNNKEDVLIVGDLNVHVGNAIPNNKDKVNIGGKILRDLLDNEDFILVNGTGKTKMVPIQDMIWETQITMNKSHVLICS